ncbi:MAG: glycosyltransferase family 4 protein [Niabella sp.]
MLEILITAIISFVVAFLAIPVVIQIADKKKLYDIPDERKLHSHAIASLGGIGIFLGFAFSSLLTLNIASHQEFQYFLAASFIIFFIGLKDDLVLLSATKKFIAQIAAAAIIIHLGGIQIESFYGLGGMEELDSMIGIPLTYITIILIMNAFNLIDGIDGLAGSLGLIVTLLGGTYFYFSNMFDYAAFSFAMAASLLAFLIFNFNPAKIFMGDSGSLLIGTIASILVLKFINVAGSPQAALPIASALAIGISAIIIPLVDTIRVFAIRIVKGRSPFSPDRNHVHHLLLDKGLGHSTVTITCVAATILLVITTYLTRFFGNTFLVIALFGTCFITLGYLYFTLPKRKMVIHRQYLVNKAREERLRTQSKVINLTTKEEMQVENMNH